MKIFLASTIFALGICVASATDITGIPENGLAAAIAAAEDGDVLILDEGEYTFDGTLMIGKAITLRGAGIGMTILKGTSGTDRHLSINHADAVIEYVTIQGKTVTCRKATGFGVQIGTSGGTLRDSRVTGFSAGSYEQTGAVELNSANAVLENCIVDENNSSWHYDLMCWCGGVYLQQGVVRDCQILNNTSHQAAGLYIKGGTAAGCLIAGNSLYFPDKYDKDLGTGAGVYAQGGMVTNCVITANRATVYSGVGGVYLSGTAAKLEDCIIRRNVTPGIAANIHPDLGYSSSASASKVSRCRLPSTFGTDCVTNVVLFKDYTNGDYTIMDAIGVDKTEALLGSAFTFTSTDAAASWTVTDATHATVATGAGAEFAFTPSVAGIFSITLEADGDSFTSAGTVKAGPVAVTVSDYAELAATVDAAVDGTVITLADGDYIVEQPIFVMKAITLQGTGWDRCRLILKDGVNDRVLFLNNKNADVTGLTVQNGRLAIYGGYPATIQSPGNGVAVRIGAVGGRMTKCRVTDTDTKNHYQNGSIAILGDDGYVGQCLIDNNDTLHQTSSGWGYGGGLYVGAGIAENCMITNNYAMNGGGVVIGGSGKLRNCTVANNRAHKTAGGILWLDGSSAQVVNCVFAANSSDLVLDTSNGKPEWAPLTVNSTQYANMVNGFSYCAFLGSEAVGANSFQAISPFIDFAGGNLYPVAGTAGLVDKGVAYEGLADKDLDDNDRTQGDSPDIGCFEADASVVSCSFIADKALLFCGEKVKLTSEIINGEPGVTYSFAWTLTDHFGNAITSAAPNPELELPCGLYSVALYAFDPAHPSVVYNAGLISDYIHIAPERMYVVAGENATSAYPYDTWENAATNVTDAVAELISGATITLGEGEHRVTAEIILNADVTVTGAGSDRSIIALAPSAPDSRVLTINSPGAVVEKIGITGGKLAVYSVNDNGVGVGVWITPNGGTVRDCRIFGNQSKNYFQYGAGVAVSGAQGLVQRCVIECNTNTYQEAIVYGGGIYLTAGLAENCLIRGNVSYMGAGAVVSQNGILRNCTVVGNSAVIASRPIYGGGGEYAGGYGGGMHIIGKGRIENTVFWGNTSERADYTGYPEWSRKETFEVNTVFLKCALPENVETNQYTDGFILVDPQFRSAAAGNFRLLTTSPLVNAGTNLNFTAADIDLDRQPRIVNFGTSKGIVDIGCYEMQNQAGTLFRIH